MRDNGRVGLDEGEFLDGGSGMLDEAYDVSHPPEEAEEDEDSLEPDYCSWMAKKGAKRGFKGSGWKKRWFELRGSKLEYFVDEGAISGQSLGDFSCILAFDLIIW